MRDVGPYPFFSHTQICGGQQLCALRKFDVQLRVANLERARGIEMRTIMLTLAACAVVLSAGAGHAQQNDMGKYCKADVERLCKGVAPGGGRLLKCLQSKPKELSVGCAKAMQKMKG